MRTYRLTAALLLCTVALPAAPAFAVNKDMVQLQTQIQELQDAVARLQQSNDERMGVLKDLVQQSADSVNRMSVTIDGLQKQLSAQQTAEGTKVDTVSGQVSALNDSLDEIKARMNRLEKALNDISGEQQSLGAAILNLPQNNTAPGLTPQTAPNTQPIVSPPNTSQTRPQSRSPQPLDTQPDQTATNVPASRVPAPTRQPASPAAPPAADLYKAAYNDYIAAKYSIASSEFGDVIRSYPDNELTGNAYYYLGEIDYRAAKYSAAAKDYDHVLEQFPDNNKAPAAHLHKGQALIALKQNDAGVRELRALIQRFPNSPEAAQARSKLNGMGIPIKPRA